MKRVTTALVGFVMAIALIGATSGTAPLVAPAAAASTYVTTKYGAPKYGQTNKSVVALQQRLYVANTLPKKYITGYYGSLTKAAVKKAQKKYGLRVTGTVNKSTWNTLVKKTGKIRISGNTQTTSTKAKAKKKTTKKANTSAYPSRGQTTSKVSELQRRLIKNKALAAKYGTGYYGIKTTNGVKRFQTKYQLRRTGKVDARTWRKLVQKTGKLSTSTRSKTPIDIDRRCTVSGRVLCISKTTDKLYYLVNGRVVKTLDARFGCAATRTREGVFSVLWKSKHHVSTLYNTPMPYSMFFSGGQAVHYSSDFAARGYAGCSHGCVNIRNKSGLAWVYGEIRTGDRVVVYKN